ncbi:MULTISPECIES: MGH1-like glycoside hydrolase domain-containing protein [Okeania]|nr:MULTISPECIES: glucosidase [Okeania]NES88189.1 glucosidase [Okeania sp. SIO2B9]NET76287.1 glucosidase [Okeania sp. SIO1F9]RQH09562.1 glucosidase [Okeania hirsuta]
MMMNTQNNNLFTQEEQRLEADLNHEAYWRRWGPYLSERQWGTVREDYSEDGSAWDYFSHEQSLSRAYRWGEDGICGISDNHQRLCFAIALWNGEDPIIKERLFGLTGSQGNHGEDVKEYYFYLDNTPSHSYMKALYKYPQSAYPYADLVAENQQRDRKSSEYELLDTGIFAENRYFDVLVEYAKATTEDILIKITVNNRGSETKTLHLLPTLWFRNTWSWDNKSQKPLLKKVNPGLIEAEHPTLGKRWFYFPQTMELFFTENETNKQTLFGEKNDSLYTKDGINNYLVNGQKNAINPEMYGTKFSPHYRLELEPGETKIVKLRLANSPEIKQPLDTEFEETFQTRIQEANEFYQRLSPCKMKDEWRNIQRQAFAGLLWTKQYYHYIVEEWLKGDPTQPPVSENRKHIRNYGWVHLFNDDIISMPDKWEYPWYAVWDLAFHAVPLAIVDPDFAKRQLDLITREWFMHPNGQLPAYEWNFSDVNPPVHAWATWRVYQIEKELYGRSDRKFLERVFQKLLLNFTWWVNQKDVEGNNVFEGGFLGLDNIGVFDRSSELPTGGHIEQSDGTSWMAMYCLDMLTIALELAKENEVYEDIASKFFEHFLYIVDAMNHLGSDGTQLWDETDNFYYDVLHQPDKEDIHIKIRSIVGLIPLFAVAIIDSETLQQLPKFQKRVKWFMANRIDLSANIACMEACGIDSERLLAIVSPERLRIILEKMLDENEFFSDYGIRSLSHFHAENPYIFNANGEEYRVDYEPAESTSQMFGGNSNWRGPIWFPINYLMIESLQRFHNYLGEDFRVECPTGSGRMMNLWEVSLEIEARLIKIFLKDENGKSPVYGDTEIFQNDPHWQNLILFYEYFHGDNGAGLGASHQTGWTGLVAKLIQQRSEYVCEI